MEQYHEDVEKRLRSLEDFRLAARVTHKQMITWISIASVCFSAAIELAFKLFSK